MNKDEAQNLRRTLVRSSGLSAEEFEERRVADRLDAIQAMEKANDSKMLTALGNAMADPAKEVKEAALQALAEKEDGIVTQLIRLGLNDADPEFRMEVLEVLADRGDRASLRRGKTDPNEDVRQRAADLLESAGR